MNHCKFKVLCIKNLERKNFSTRKIYCDFQKSAKIFTDSNIYFFVAQTQYNCNVVFCTNNKDEKFQIITNVTLDVIIKYFPKSLTVIKKNLWC